MPVGYELVTKSFQTTEGYAERYRAACARLDLAQEREEMYGGEPDKTHYHAHWNRVHTQRKAEIADLIYEELSKHMEKAGLDWEHFEDVVHFFGGRIMQISTLQPDFLS